LQPNENENSGVAQRGQKLWFFEYLDHIASTELKARSALQGSTQIRYAAARSRQGGLPLSRIAADRMLAALKPGAVVLLTTGTGNPVWLPQGETDGPSGIAVLARVFAALKHRVCILSEGHFLPAILASVQAAGVPVLAQSSWRQRPIGALAVDFPQGKAAAHEFVPRFLDGLPEVAIALFVEKPGPNVAGVFHNSSGKPKAPDWVGHLNVLADLARERGIVTGAVGDGGNEIGFGMIREALANVHPYAAQCGCPCGKGIIDATEVDFLFPAAVSNWGAYAIAAALAASLDRPEVMPDWREVEASIIAPLAHGAFDGYSGMSVASVDGTSLQTNKAVYQLICEVLRLAAAPAH
jgi:hypothetical protein